MAKGVRDAFIMLKWLAKNLLEFLPPQGKAFVRRVKFYTMGWFSPQSYWDFAASTCATAAICTDCVDEKQFFALGKQEATLLRKLELLHPKVRVLDIGCGIGRIERAICGDVESVTGVDVSSRMVELARQKVPADNVTFQLVDGRSLNGVASGNFDLCVSFLVFQHLPRPVMAAYFSEVARVLKRTGRFFFQLPLAAEGQHPEPPAHHPFGMRYYTADQVQGLLDQHGFRLVNRFNSEGRPIPPDGLLHSEFQFFLAARPQADP